MLSVHPEMNAPDANGDTAHIKCSEKYIVSGIGDILSSIIALLYADADPDLENNVGNTFVSFLKRIKISN